MGDSPAVVVRIAAAPAGVEGLKTPAGVAAGAAGVDTFFPPRMLFTALLLALTGTGVTRVVTTGVGAAVDSTMVTDFFTFSVDNAWAATAERFSGSPT